MLRLNTNQFFNNGDVMKYHKLRLLDLDDLIILKYLREKKSGSEIGKLMGLSSPAISHRLKRVDEVLGEPAFTKKSARRELTAAARKLSDKCIKALDALLE